MADLVYVVNKLAAEFLEMNKNPTTTATKRGQSWCKPPRDWLKVNVDGAFSASTGDGGWGFVIRDDAGEPVMASAGRLRHLRDALQAEVFACIQGVKAAAEKGITNLILETDSMILKEALANDSYRLDEVGGLILELKHIIAGGFSSFICSYAPRNCNKEAHVLATKGSLLSDGGESRWESTPVFVNDLVASEIAASMS
jgi:hypothetical protein